ncbi:MAG: Fe-S cluster assembly protein SufD [Bdellovibrionales bacterium]|nr:Fe-S cluster assembly protein SufD [Bdellovibrionales bacterium]
MSQLTSNFNTILSPQSADIKLNALREGAKKSFLVSAIPTRRDESWRYLDLRPIFESSYKYAKDQKVSLEEQNGFSYKIVFINGIYDSSRSKLPDGLSVSLLSDAIDKDLVQLDKLTNKNIFTNLNVATVSTGYHISCTKLVSEPVAIQHAQSVDGNYGANLVVVTIKSNASLSVLEDSSCDTHFINNQLMVQVDAGGRLDWTQLHQSKTATKYQNTEVYLDKGSNLNFTQVNLGGGLVRQDVKVDIKAADVNASLQGLYLLKDKQVVDNHIAVNHLSPNSTCKQNYKGILDNTARAVFDGKIFVAVGADGTAASQLNKNILLSNTAEVDTKPQLEIYADDVKCNHGATLGKFSDEELFYFSSRGIDKAAAIHMLSSGFVRDVLLHIENAEIQKYLMPLIDKQLKDYSF